MTMMMAEVMMIESVMVVVMIVFSYVSIAVLNHNNQRQLKSVYVGL